MFELDLEKYEKLSDDAIIDFFQTSIRNASSTQKYRGFGTKV